MPLKTSQIFLPSLAHYPTDFDFRQNACFQHYNLSEIFEKDLLLCSLYHQCFLVIATKTITNSKSGKQSDDRVSKFIKLSKSTKNIKAASITNICKPQMKMKRAFTTLNAKHKEMNNEDSDLTDSDDDEE